MRIYLITIGRHMPTWVSIAYHEYVKRMWPHCRLELIEVNSVKRSKSSTMEKNREEEARHLLAAVPTESYKVVLDERGKEWDSVELAQWLKTWQSIGRNVSFLVGGADGLAESCYQQADQVWSLSRLTLPHALVRVVVAEQIYRAQMILSQHPYHRGS